MNEARTSHENGRGLPFAIGLVSFSALVLELSLTRLFSVVLFYHFAFLAISLALLGLGAGGVFAFIRREWLGRWGEREIAASMCLLGSVSIPVVLEVVLHSSISLAPTMGNLVRLTLLYLVSAFPFFCCGVLLSVVFARVSGRIPRLYGADLAGGSLACLLTVPALNWLGAPNAILLSATVLAFAAFVWSEQHKTRGIGVRLSLVLVALILINGHGRLFDIVYAKGTYRDPKRVEFARWNAISRVEVDNQDGARAIVIDADASSYIMNIAPEKWAGTVWQKNLMSAAPSPVNVLRPTGDYAIIGPGGGVDVLRALGNGSKNVTGIEINPIIANDIMRGRYADFSYRLYERPDVHIHVADGRSFIRNSKDLYDVVQMTLVDTWASTAAGAFALSENSLYTVEAFREYFDHLKPDGMLAITRWEFKSPREALRILSNAIVVLHEIGIQDVQSHFIIVSDGQLNEDGRPVLVLAKKSAFTRTEEIAVLEHLERNKNLALIYSPSDHSRPAGVHPVDPTLRWNPFTAMIVSNDPVGFAQKYAYNVGPVTDDAPFFFFTLKLKDLFVSSPLQNGIDWKVNLGVLVLLIVLAISTLAVLAFLIFPLLWHAPAKGQSPWQLLYFVAVGLGYIVIEITLIQRFVLYLGNPTYALTVVIFLLLLSSGVGSLLSRRWVAGVRVVWAPILAITGVVILYAFMLPATLLSTVGWILTVKLLVSAGLLVPLGLLMGMPFPTGLRAMAPQSDAVPDAEVGALADGGGVEWAWALNAAASVLGAVLAIVIAIEWGLTVTLWVAALVYLSSAILSRSFGVVRASSK
jgi:hypothetical protein